MGYILIEHKYVVEKEIKFLITYSLIALETVGRRALLYQHIPTTIHFLLNDMKEENLRKSTFMVFNCYWNMKKLPKHMMQ